MLMMWLGWHEQLDLHVNTCIAHQFGGNEIGTELADISAASADIAMSAQLLALSCGC